MIARAALLAVLAAAGGAGGTLAGHVLAASAPSRLRPAVVYDPGSAGRCAYHQLISGAHFWSCTD